MIIGFCGGTGAGKSTLVEYAAKILGTHDTLIISQDHYYKHELKHTFEERSLINFDHPNAVDFELLTTHLIKLKEGNIIQRPVYSFEAHQRKSETVLCEPKKHLLVEGILIFTHQPLVDQFDLKVYIEAAKDVRIQRRIARDVVFRGRTEKEVRERFDNTLHAMHEQFIAPHKQHSDLILANNNDIETTKTTLEQWLNKQVLDEKNS